MFVIAATLGLTACGDGASTTGAASSTASTAAKPKPSSAASAKPEKSADKPAPSAAPGPAGSASPSAASDGGTNTVGFDTPEAFGKAMAEAFSDPSKLGSLFPADSVLDANLECTPPDTFHKVVRGAMAEIAKELTKEKGPWEFVKAEVQGEAKKLPKGEKADGCTLKADAETTKFRVTIKSAKGEDDGGVEIIKLGGKYYAIGM